MTSDIKAFGPSALVTPANVLTLGRLLAGPAFAVVIAEVNHASWTLFALWLVLSFSDGLDGWVARWHGTTRSGAFLDPLADKFLVLGALAALANRNVISWVAVAIIAAREIAMTVYRSHVGKHGVSVPARFSAKLKTVAQDCTVAFALAPLIANGRGLMITITLWIAVALSITTGFSYYRDARQGSTATSAPQEPVAPRQTN